MENAKQRLSAIANHLGTASGTIDIAELQHLLEHDNWDTRRKLKELMKDDLYVPYVCLLPLKDSFSVSVPFSSNSHAAFYFNASSGEWGVSIQSAMCRECHAHFYRAIHLYEAFESKANMAEIQYKGCITSCSAE